MVIYGVAVISQNTYYSYCPVCESKGLNLTFSHPGDKIRYLQALATLGDPPAFQEPDSSDRSRRIQWPPEPQHFGTV